MVEEEEVVLELLLLLDGVCPSLPVGESESGKGEMFSFTFLSCGQFLRERGVA